MNGLTRRQWVGAAAGALFCLAADARAEGAAPVEHAESYRLRLHNQEFGPVEASADGGHTWATVGRVLRSATATVPDRTASGAEAVLRSTGLGLAICIGPSLALKVRPFHSVVPLARGKSSKIRLPPPELGAVLTNLEQERELFGDLAPPEGSPAGLQMGDSIQPFPQDYAPSAEDRIVIRVSLPAPAGERSAESWPSRVRKRIEALAKAYASEAAGRARSEGRSVVSGNLTLNARLPAGEPDPIAAVTYSVDDQVIAAQNVAPFSYVWDTRRVQDGEHVVEIRALNGSANVVTRVRALIVIANSAP